MTEFEQKDYGEARDYANKILGNANNINDIFNNLDKIMNRLYGDDWSSKGAKNARDRYDEIRKNYQLFYDQVVAMKNHVDEATGNYEAADAQASGLLTKI